MSAPRSRYLSIAAIAAIALLVLAYRHRALSETFTATNIVATSTVTTPTYKVTGGTTPTITVCTTDPPSAVQPAGSLCLDTIPTPSTLYQSQGGGSWTQIGTGGGTTSLAMTNGAAGNVDVSTEGTIDWYAQVACNDPPSTVGMLNQHQKLTGNGEIPQTFQWLLPTAGAQACDNATVATYTTTSDIGDDGAGGRLNASTQFGRVFWISGWLPGGGWRFRFTAPAGTQRVARVRFMHYSSTVTCTASMDDGTAAPQTITDSAAASSYSAVLLTITVTAGRNTDVLLRCYLSAAATGDPNIGFGSVTIAPS